MINTSRSKGHHMALDTETDGMEELNHISADKTIQASKDWENFERKAVDWLQQFSNISDNRVQDAISQLYMHIRKGEAHPEFREKIVADLMQFVETAREKMKNRDSNFMENRLQQQQQALVPQEHVDHPDFEEDASSCDNDDENESSEEAQTNKTNNNNKKHGSKKRNNAALGDDDESDQDTELDDDDPSSNNNDDTLLSGACPSSKKRECSVGMDVIHKALACPFIVNCMSFQGSFMVPSCLGKIPVRLDLDEVCKCFTIGQVWVGPQSKEEVLTVKEVCRERKNHSSSNFIVVKFTFGKLKLTLKLYSSRYFQLYGATDSHNMTGEDICNVVVDFVKMRLQNSGHIGTQVGEVEGLGLIALSAYHRGLSDQGLGLDLAALKAALKDDKTVKHRTLGSNSRTGALVLRSGKGRGSWFYHAKGTVQLFGTKQTPSEAIKGLTNILLRYPYTVVLASEAVNGSKSLGGIKRKGKVTAPTVSNGNNVLHVDANVASSSSSSPNKKHRY